MRLSDPNDPLSEEDIEYMENVHENSKADKNSGRSNNTHIEVPDIEIPALNYSGPYNEDIRKELEKICPPDVLKYMDIASKTLDKEDFNDLVNIIFDRERIITPNYDQLLSQGIEKLRITDNGFSMYSPAYNINKLYAVGDVDQNLGIAFMLPGSKRFKSRLFVDIEQSGDIKNIIVHDYINLKNTTNFFVASKVNIYENVSLGENSNLEMPYDSKFGIPVQSGYSNELDFGEPLKFKVPQNTNISRVELQYDILITDGLIYPYRQTKVNMYLPKFAQ